MVGRRGVSAVYRKVFLVLMVSAHKTAEVLLLTGAGFTKSFGGYLSSEMWAAIFNQPEIKKYPGLRKALLSDPNLDYESVYDKVLSQSETAPRYTDDEKHAFSRAVFNTYAAMHEEICGPSSPGATQGEIAWKSFFARFGGTTGVRGFFFTLNHDLFVEEYFKLTTVSRRSIRDAVQLSIPGTIASSWYNGRLYKDILNGRKMTLPTADKVEGYRDQFDKPSSDNFVYVKLHGSYGWVSQTENDVMIIGHAKSELLKREPLLCWYLSLFEKVINEPDRRLVVIGYGFRDAHINELLWQAVHRGLRLYVVSPKEAMEFKEVLDALKQKVTIKGRQSYTSGEILWSGLDGYCKGQVTDFYDVKQSDLTPKGKAFLGGLGLYP